MDNPDRPNPSAAEQFAAQSQERSPSVARELFDFLRQNKKWWLIPIVAILLLIGVVIVVVSTMPVLLYPM